IEGTRALDERIAYLLDLPPASHTIADCGAILLDEDRKFTRSLSATRRLLPEAVRWRIEHGGSNTPVGASVEPVEPHPSPPGPAGVPFSAAPPRGLWGERPMAEARRR